LRCRLQDARALPACPSELAGRHAGIETHAPSATLSVVIPHWPLDDDVDASLRRCLASLPSDCEKLVVVNEGTGFGRNVNLGLRLARGDYVAVVGNDTWVVGGDVCDLCVPDVVASPLVIGDMPGIAPPLEPDGMHGAFWVAPRAVLDRVGLLDERFEFGFYDDDDLLARLREAGVSTRRVRSVRVRHVGGLTMRKLAGREREWLRRNEEVFRAKWGWVPAPLFFFRRAGAAWHYCRNCPNWPEAKYEECTDVPESGTCARCRELWDAGDCEIARRAL
jgi:GT2 family glycosyltransferase